MSKPNFQTASEMPYANNEKIKSKAELLFAKLIEYLKSVKKDESLFFKSGEIVYIPDIHGDFVHLIITLYRHGVLKSDLKLKKEFKYVFLGDFYDRAPDSDVIDFWLNMQIKNDLEIYKLIGNHEMAFLERNEIGYPIIFPSQDSIMDASNNFQITEDLLKNIADGNILAAYVERNILYIHSYIINDDFAELGMDKSADILDFATALNKRLKEHGQEAYSIFLNCKKEGKYNWKSIIKPFKDDPLFDIHKIRNEMHTSFIWRRTGVSTLNIYPSELEVEIPDNVYQIVGHTPVFSFRIPNNQSVAFPFVLSSKNGLGKVQFSDIGIGYYYKKDDFERPEVSIRTIL
jgi:hypothetical protein